VAQRIKTKPEELRDQITTAVAGINGAGASWPSTAPTKTAVQTAGTDLAAAITAADAAEAAWKLANQTRKTKADICYGLMQRIDQVTDGLYGPSGAEKNNYGLTPKGAPIPALHKLVQIVTQDGLAPSDGNPQFHHQMVYAVAMRTIHNFERALGRRIHWKPRPDARTGGDPPRKRLPSVDEVRFGGLSVAAVC